MARSDAKQERTECFSFVIAVILAVFFVSGFSILEHSGKGANAVIGHELINPNYADLASLERLPGIGPSRGHAIILFRKEFYSKTHSKEAFKKATDLRKVNSIGPKTVEALRDYIRFDGD